MVMMPSGGDGSGDCKQIIVGTLNGALKSESQIGKSFQYRYISIERWLRLCGFMGDTGKDMIGQKSLKTSIFPVLLPNT